MFEKLLMAKVGLWLTGLVLVAAFVGTILFGAIVKNEAEGYGRFGRIGALSYELASVPAEISKLFRDNSDHGMSIGQSHLFPGLSGWVPGEAATAEKLEGYILLSRYDGDIFRSAIELVELPSGEVKHRITIDTAEMFADVDFDKGNQIATPWIPERFRAVHPLALSNGDLLIKDHSGPLARVTPCGDLVWLNDQLDFHHSLNRDANGDFWVPTRVPLDNETTGLVDSFDNMGLSKVSEGGEILYSVSVGDILINNGLEHLILSVDEHFEPNTMHLNDIEPVLSDGPYWQEGDVFISLRALSAIVQYRPSTDEIIWMKRGPWLGQHDVDIIDDHTIAVFDNDTVNLGRGPVVRGSNKVLYYDFATDTVSHTYDAAMAQHNVRTVWGGLFDQMPNGLILVEETGSGRVLGLDADGNLAFQYVNRANDGKLYHVSWSRYLPVSEGQALDDQLAQAACN